MQWLLAWVGSSLIFVALALPVSARDLGGGSRYYERQIETDRPVHGYSGWVWGGGSRSLYCDYPIASANRIVQASSDAASRVGR